MKRRLLNRMICPYCLGSFRASSEVKSDATRIVWGLVTCRCFTFPIVDGVLLLSLAKGYGGSEEVVQPYTPLQVAAIRFLQQRDIAGLRQWIARHVPLLSRLLDPAPLMYVDFIRDLNSTLFAEVERDLHAWGRWEVLGRRAAGHRDVRAAIAATRAGALLLAARARWFPNVFDSFYVSRFVTTQLPELRVRLGPLPFDGFLLSLCCGHGPFELLARLRGVGRDIVSVDGQVLNLFVTKRFVNPEGDFICHDVQFPLPFADGDFDGVFSSSCLIEIPSQALFIREAIRATRQDGWCAFDAVGPEPEMRVNPVRFYRVCQNSFDSLGDYHRVFAEAAAGRRVSMTNAIGNGPWTTDVEMLESMRSATFAVSTQPLNDSETGAWSAGDRAHLYANPRFDVADEGSRLVGRRKRSGRRRERWSETAPDAAGRLTIEKARLADSHYLDELTQGGLAVFLPPQFSRDAVPLSAA